MQPEGDESKLTSVAQRDDDGNAAATATTGDVDVDVDVERRGEWLSGFENELLKNSITVWKGGGPRRGKGGMVPAPEMGARLLIGRVGRKSPRDWLLLPC